MSALRDNLMSSPAAAATAAVLSEGGPAWFVGGALRDALLGREVRDVDVAVPAGSEREIADRLAASCGGKRFELSAEHATWRVLSADASWHVDIAATRGSGIEEDLLLRDFTVNALALPVAGGAVIDPAGGLADADAGLLRLASPQAFASDPLRLLRAARIATDAGLRIDRETGELARSAARSASEPAGERQFAEIRGIVCGPDPIEGLALLDELELTAVVLPEVDAMRGVVQGSNHHLDVHGHSLAVLERVLELERDPAAIAADEPARESLLGFLGQALADDMTRGEALRFGALLHDAGKPGTRREEDGGIVTFRGHDELGSTIVAGFCDRLRTSRRFRRHLQGLALHHLRLGFLIHEMPLTRRRVYDYLRATDEVACDVTVLSAADRLSARGSGPLADDEMIAAHLSLVREMIPDALDWASSGPPESPLDGNEVAAAAGIDDGPSIGRVLEGLRAAAFAGEVSGREEAAELARQIAAESE